MFHRLLGFAIIPGERSINEIEERYLMHPHDFPGSLETPKIDGAQLRIASIAKNRMITKKGQLIVPGSNLIRRKCHPQPDRVSLITPLQELPQAFLEPGVARERVCR